MARLWMSGFGLGSTSTDVEFSTVSGTVSLGTTNARLGPNTMRCNPTAGTAFMRYHQYTTDVASVGFLRVYVYVATLPNGNTTILRLSNAAANNACVQVRMTATGTLILLDAASNTIGSASTALSTNTWHMIELSVDAAANPGTVTARLNGSQFATGANSAQSQWARVVVGPVVTTTCDLYFADVALNDSTGSAQTSWPGSGAVLTLWPNATGDSNAWNNTANTAGDANNFNLVWTVNDTTDYVQTGTLNAEDMYNIDTPALGNNDIINCAMIGARYRNNTADAVLAARVQARASSGGTTSQGTDMVPNGATFQTNTNAQPHGYTLILHNNPSGFAWTPKEIREMQIGVKITTAGTQRMQITGVWALVDYTPGAATPYAPPLASPTRRLQPLLVR